ncbi:B-box zinc finger [Desulfocarbo indianensis]|nr:B-box zinc finger [Desulfocarbo indianensis]
MSQTDNCIRHPERASVARCQKHGGGLCQECLDNDPRCFDPDLFCKFRPQCVISFRDKEERRQARSQGEAL